MANTSMPYRINQLALCGRNNVCHTLAVDNSMTSKGQRTVLRRGLVQTGVQIDRRMQRRRSTSWANRPLETCWQAGEKDAKVRSESEVDVEPCGAMWYVTHPHTHSWTVQACTHSSHHRLHTLINTCMVSNTPPIARPNKNDRKKPSRYGEGSSSMSCMRRVWCCIDHPGRCITTADTNIRCSMLSTNLLLLQLPETLTRRGPPILSVLCVCAGQAQQASGRR